MDLGLKKVTMSELWGSMYIPKTYMSEHGSLLELVKFHMAPKSPESRGEITLNHVGSF